MLTKRIFPALIFFTAVATVAAAQGTRNFAAVSGAEARTFQVPAGTELIRTFDLPAQGLTYERYQQTFGPANAAVLGGQITVLKNENGDIEYAVGAYYDNLNATNPVNVTAAQARQRAAQDVGAAGERLVSLRINPANGRYFYEVDTRRANSRWIHWIDAGNGAIVNKFDALMHDSVGLGVQFSEDATDVKDLTGLTTFSGGQYHLLSIDGRQETHDQGSTNRPFLGPIATDSNDTWDLLGNTSPAQQALVDAHYYAWVTDAYFGAVHGFDWVGHAIANGVNTKMEIHAHYSKNYNNAFWNGRYIALGDGDQVTFEELTALDVISHELTHGVTEFTSNLIYQNESGALNEAFSDIMGSSTEFFADTNGLEPAVTLAPDWLIGEDFDLTNDTAPGFRNMADPTEDGDPSHYADRYTGTGDNGGVHINSGIANHWYYLLVNGGQNAKPSRASGSDVTGVGLASAEAIAFLGFTILPENATFCDARAATIAIAGSLDGNVGDAWDEVGVTSGLCGGGDTNAAPSADFTFTTSELTATFTDASIDTDGTIATWTWDFGDGNSSTEQNPVHAYAAAGTYSVVLTVHDDDGAPDSTTKSVEVTSGETNAAPTADFTFTTSDLTATFSDASSDTDGTIASWSWDFGDGNSSTEQNPVHTYATAGTYSVELTVTDDDTATNSVTKSVEVTSPGGFTLSVTAYKTRGLHKADLTWSGATSTNVDIHRDGVLIATTANDGSYTDNIDQRGSASYVYTVCEVGGGVCSNEATATF